MNVYNMVVGRSVDIEKCDIFFLIKFRINECDLYFNNDYRYLHFMYTEE